LGTFDYVTHRISSQLPAPSSQLSFVSSDMPLSCLKSCQVISSTVPHQTYSYMFASSHSSPVGLAMVALLHETPPRDSHRIGSRGRRPKKNQPNTEQKADMALFGAWGWLDGNYRCQLCVGSKTPAGLRITTSTMHPRIRALRPTGARLSPTESYCARSDSCLVEYGRLSPDQAHEQLTVGTED
jgi:hypothetical protein